MGSQIPTLPFESSYGLRFRGKGITGVADPLTNSNIDYKLTADRYLNGCQLIIKTANWGDYVKFQVVDVDNILGYGAGTVLDQFGDTWYLSSAEQNQGVFKIEYPAKIVVNLYIRIVYTNTGALPVNVACNLFLHQLPA